MQTMRLSELLEATSILGRGEHMYMCLQNEFSESTIVAVLTRDEVDVIEEDGVFESEEAAAAWEIYKNGRYEEVKNYLSKNQLRYIFSTRTLQDIIENAKMQKANISISQLVKAFDSYVKHDAFIDLLKD